LRHHHKIKPKAGDFALVRRVTLGDDVLALHAPFAAADAPGTAAGTNGAGAPPDPARPLRRRLPAASRSPKMRP
jgi:hypothetical protein